MLIKLTDFNTANYDGIKIISNTETGLFAVQYEQVAKAQPPELKPDRGWYYDQTNDHYSLVIPQPQKRNVLRAIMVARTSTNHYEIAYADTLGCIFTTAKSISAVHDILMPLWERTLKQ